jgi:hypothetical protein
MSALPKFTVKNFTDADELKCAALDYSGEQGIGEKLVVLNHRAGSMDFQHAMKPAQARELANALNACADALEVEVMEVGNA